MRAVSVTNRGGRENNEDFLRHAQSGNLWCFVLCDGLGGHEGGEVASKLVAETICKEFSRAPELSETAAQAYIKAACDALIRMRAEKIELYDMSTTAALLLTDGEKAVWAHIGDSRVYYLEQGEISLITDDHSVAFLEFESGIITYDEIRKSPNQNKLLRCVGGASGADADVSGVVPVKSGDAFLLCSDGFWEYVNESDIEKQLSEASSPQEWLEKMLAVLHENENDGNDNYSAIAVMV